MAWPERRTSSCRKDSSAPGGDADLLVDDVDAGHRLGHRMLDLKARVHLDEVEFAVLEEELDGSRAGIFDVGHRLGDDPADPVPHLGVDHRGGRLFPDLLVPPLERAVALAEMDGAALAVAQHLDLDVARPVEIFLEIERIVAEGRAGLGPRGGERVGEVLRACGRPSCRGRRRRRRP